VLCFCLTCYVKKGGSGLGSLLPCLLLVVFKQWRGGLVFLPELLKQIGGSGLGYPPIVFIVIKQGVVDVGSC
jgi:hypothetical protein